MTTQPTAAHRRQRTPRKGPGRPAAGQTLTPRDVTEAAAHLINTEGEGALTMRRLGEVLGVKAMALYNHFPDKEAILDSVASLAFAGLPVPPLKGHWKSRINALCFGLRDMARRRPHLFRVAMTRRIPPDKALPHIAAALSAFADAGLPPAAQAYAYHTLRLFVRAHCLWEIDELGPSTTHDPAAPTVAAAFDAGTGAAARHLIAPDPDRLFEAGLDLILKGLQYFKHR